MALNYRSSMARYRRYVLEMEDNQVVRSSFFALFTLSLVLVMVIFALRPTLTTIATLVGQIQKGKEVSVELDRKIANVQRASELLSTNAANLALLDEAMPKTPEWAGWMGRMEGAASESGVAIQSLEVGPVTIEGLEQVVVNPNTALNKSVLPNGVTGIPFTMTLTGDYEQIKTYIKTLTQLRRIAYISECVLTKKPDSVLSATINGYITYMSVVPTQ